MQLLTAFCLGLIASDGMKLGQGNSDKIAQDTQKGMTDAIELYRYAIVIENVLVRQALVDALQICDCQVIYAAEDVPSDELIDELKVTIWCVSKTNSVRYGILKKFKTIIIDDFLPIPKVFQADYQTWFVHFRQAFALKIQQITQPSHSSELDQEPVNAAELTELPVGAIRHRPLPIVCLIGASAGGIQALKQFLETMPTHPDLRLIVAQHGDEVVHSTMIKQFNRGHQWRMRMLTDGTQLEAGKAYLVPNNRTIVVRANGRIDILDQPWDSEYTPCISQVMLSLSQVFGPSLVTLIFSGMMSDGSDAISKVVSQGGLIWTQSIDSCQATSQPNAANATGQVSYMGSPIDLAKALLKMFKRYDTLTDMPAVK